MTMSEKTQQNTGRNRTMKHDRILTPKPVTSTWTGFSASKAGGCRAAYEPIGLVGSVTKSKDGEEPKLRCRAVKKDQK